MKNSKAIFLIVLGAFVMATGFAFAEPQPALEQLKEAAANAPAVTATPAGGGAAATTAAGTNTPGTQPTITINMPKPPEAAKPAEVKKEEPAPTFGQKIKSFIGNHKREILLGTVGAFLGLALVGGPAGLLIGGMVALAFFWFVGL